MNKKSQTDALNESIIELENRRNIELKLLKEQFQDTCEGLKPTNLIKNALQDVSPTDIKNTVVNSVIGLTTGYLSKKVLVGATHNPLKKIVGTILQFAVANIVSKHTDSIKSSGEYLINNIFRRKKKPLQTTQQFPGNEN